MRRKWESLGGFGQEEEEEEADCFGISANKINKMNEISGFLVQNREPIKWIWLKLVTLANSLLYLNKLLKRKEWNWQVFNFRTVRTQGTSIEVRKILNYRNKVYSYTNQPVDLLRDYNLTRGDVNIIFFLKKPELQVHISLLVTFKNLHPLPKFIDHLFHFRRLTVNFIN